MLSAARLTNSGRRQAIRPRRRRHPVQCFPGARQLPVRSPGKCRRSRPQRIASFIAGMLALGQQASAMSRRPAPPRLGRAIPVQARAGVIGIIDCYHQATSGADRSITSGTAGLVGWLGTSLNTERLEHRRLGRLNSTRRFRRQPRLRRTRRGVVPETIRHRLRRQVKA